MGANQGPAAASTGSYGGSGAGETGKKETGKKGTGGDMLAACACVRLVMARGSDLAHETGEPITHDGPDPGR